MSEEALNDYIPPVLIDPAADRAVYKQLADIIRAQIQSGEYRPGQRLPAQKDYMYEHGVSRSTVDRTMTLLRNEGLIATNRRGSRVRVQSETAATVVPLDRGKVSARMPTEPERRRHGINQGVPVLLVTRYGQTGEAEETHPVDRVEIHIGIQSDGDHGVTEGMSPLTWKAQAYQFEYLRSEDDTFFLGLNGPRGDIHSFPIALADMGRLLDAYFRALGAPPREEREAAWQAARAEVLSGVGIPIEVVIARRMGLSLEEATALWEQKVAEAPGRRAALLRTLPRWDKQQVIRLGGEAAVVVPMATYRSLCELEQRVRPRMAELTEVVEAHTVGEWRAEQEAETDDCAGL